MKVLEVEKSTITKAQFEAALKIKIAKIEIVEGSYIKITTFTAKHIYYLRCDDIRELFNLDYNVFSEDIEIIGNDVVIKTAKEVYRGAVGKWKF